MSFTNHSYILRVASPKSEMPNMTNGMAYTSQSPLSSTGLPKAGDDMLKAAANERLSAGTVSTSSKSRNSGSAGSSAARTRLDATSATRSDVVMVVVVVVVVVVASVTASKNVAVVVAGVAVVVVAARIGPNTVERERS